VVVKGGGLRDSYTGILRFDGKRYSANPSMNKKPTQMQGKNIIDYKTYTVEI